MYHSYNNQAVLIFSAHFLSIQLTLSFPYPCISLPLSPLPSASPSALGSIDFLLRLCYSKNPMNPERPPRCLLMASGLTNAAGTSPKLKIQGRTIFRISQGFGVMLQLLVHAPSLLLPPILN